MVTDPDWKLKYKGEQWFLGDTYNFSIGQGDLALTPVGINQEAQILASDGELCVPQVEEDTPHCKKLSIKTDYLDVVRQGMEMACSDGGTVSTFLILESPKVACKTWNC